MPLFDYEDEITDQNTLSRGRRQRRLEPFRGGLFFLRQLLPWFIWLAIIIPILGQIVGLGSLHPIIETYIETVREARVAIWERLIEMWRRIGALNGWW